MAEIFTVETRGIGKPDYTREVSSSLERRGIKLAYGQTLKVFGLVFTTEIQFVALAALGYVNCVPADIGKMVVDDGANTAVLSAYDNTLRQWRIGWLTPVALGSVMTITGGVGGGVALGSVLNPFPWVVPPLAPGATAHVIDNSTGLPSPLTVPRGYIIFLISAGEMVTEDGIALGYIDGALAVTVGVFSGGGPYYENYILGLSTETVDPTGLTAHTMDVTITNLGAGNLEGGIDLIGIVQAIGTPPLPTVKTVRCKSCGHEEVVPQETTRWICTVCGQLNIYYDLTKMKGTR